METCEPIPWNIISVRSLTHLSGSPSFVPCPLNGSPRCRLRELPPGRPWRRQLACCEQSGPIERCDSSRSPITTYIRGDREWESWFSVEKGLLIRSGANVRFSLCLCGVAGANKNQIWNVRELDWCRVLYMVFRFPKPAKMHHLPLKRGAWIGARDRKSVV
jgi:hypothetical protein